MTIFDRARQDPHGLAVDDGRRSRSWAELAERATRVARFLREDAELAPDDHAAILMGNRSEYVEIVLGAILAGVWLTPINWHLARDETAYIVADSGAKLVFTDEAFEPVAREAGARAVLPVGEPLEAALASASDAPMPLDGPPGSTMIYTSGTTGRPKGVKRTRKPTVGEALEAQSQLGRSYGLDGSGPHLVTGPMYHAAPLLFAIYDQASGAPIVILPRWDEREALRWIVEREIAHTHMVPTMFVRLLRLPEEERAAFHAPKLSLVMHGAAPVSVPVKRRMIEWLGPILLEYWGATEGGVNTLATSEEWMAHPGTVGRVLPAFEVFARDDDGNRLPDGQTGALYCRHRQMARVFAYHGAPEKTAEAHPEPHLFTIGDVGWVDDGWVHLADRKSHMIISGGVNVYPAEVEQVLQEHPAVADVAVFGIPDDEWGESVKAAVELVPGHEPGPELERAILDFGREHLARYKVPRSIDFEARLPRHESGKLYVRKLRDPYWQGRERRI
ncbi:MAG TPA: AMP-binding protein [Myxococcota bacterium]|nr:AMP-binding protein [Myxococcota bacterium]